MKYGIAQWCFPNGLYAFRVAAEAGYEGIQVETGLDSNGYYLCDPLMRKIYREESDRYNMEIISVVDNDLMYIGCQGARNETEYKKSILAIDLTIETAAALGCKKMMLPMFFRSQIHMSKPETFDRAVEVLKYACHHASDMGVIVQVETSIPAKNQRVLMEAVDMPNLTNFYDFQNLYWYEGLDALQELPDLMPLNGEEMHLCDGWGVLSKDTNGGRLLGEGEAHFEEQMKIICEYGWDGWLIVENGYHLPSLRNRGSYEELSKYDLETVKSTVQKYSL